MSDIAPLIGPEYALQEAVYTALLDNPLLISALGGPKIYDRAPEDARFPYIAFAGLSTGDGSTASERGYECRIVLNVWSRHKGKREAFDILRLVRLSLDGQDLVLSGYALVNLREEFADVSQDRDRLTYRGTIRFRAFIEIV